MVVLVSTQQSKLLGTPYWSRDIEIGFIKEMRTTALEVIKKCTNLVTLICENRFNQFHYPLLVEIGLIRFTPYTIGYPAL